MLRVMTLRYSTTTYKYRACGKQNYFVFYIPIYTTYIDILIEF